MRECVRETGEPEAEGASVLLRYTSKAEGQETTLTHTHGVYNTEIRLSL